VTATVTINTYQIQVGFMAPQTGSMLVPAKTREEAERKALEHINHQFSHGTIIQCHLLSSEEVPEDIQKTLDDSQEEASVVVPFKPKT